MIEQADQSAEIDGRSFHVFEFGETRLLFDRATGVTMELNQFAYEAMRLIEEKGIDAAEKDLMDRYRDLTDFTLESFGLKRPR